METPTLTFGVCCLGHRHRLMLHLWSHLYSHLAALSPYKMIYIYIYIYIYTYTYEALTFCPLHAPALFFSTVPAAPENVTLTNSTSRLLVTWTTDPPNGVISNYTIYVTRVEMGNASLSYTSTNTRFDIPSGDLDPYELVLVSVSANNSAGEGARSLSVRERTREERKSSTIIIAA